jgi:ribosome biogenesis GTPase
MSGPLNDESHEQYFKEDRKDEKKRRKLAGSRDRSKYKKTDKEKYLKNLESEKEAKLAKQPEGSRLEGRVLSINAQGIVVDWQGQRVTCSLKGLLKKDKTQAKNLVTVGDFVLFEMISENQGIIVQVKPRKSTLSRADNLSRRKEQLLASNIDQVLITVSLVDPPLKSPIVDRYIIATRKGNMEPIIVVNKIDLLKSTHFDPVLVERQKLMYEEFLSAYASAGVPVISVSTATGEGMDLLRDVMRGKASVFSGQSGVGKSSLINAVTGSNLKVGETVISSKKGSHTTSVTQLIQLDFGGWCIDTPGIKSFGIWGLKREDVERYFTEIHAFGRACKFLNCSHSHEEACSVLNALEAGDLSYLRYESYQSLLQSAGEEHVKR